MAEKGMFETAGDFIGGALDNMSILDKIAVGVSPIPIVGDIVGGVADAVNIGGQISDTGEVPWTDVGLALTGLLPFVPPAAAARGIRGGLASMSEKALANVPNDLPGFYGGKRYSQPLAMAGGAARAAKNMVQQAYSPRSQALYSEYGVPLQNKRLIDKAVKEFEDAADVVLNKESRKKLSSTGKKVMGEINYQRLINDQYGNRETLYKALDGVDHVDFANLSPKSYNKIMGAATGLKNKDVETVFRAITQVQGVDPNKAYRMAIRRPYTGQAGGNLNAAITKAPIYGGQTVGTLKKAFRTPTGANKTFKSNSELIKGLEEQGITVYNKEKALKKGDVVLVQGAAKTDAFELGGANYVTAIKKDGTIVSFTNDANDIVGIPATPFTKKRDMQAPFADRMVTVSTPIHFDLLDRGSKGPRRSAAVQSKLDSLTTQAADIRNNATTSNLNVLKGSGFNRPQSDFVRNVANLEPSAQALRRGTAQAAGNVGLFATRAGKPIERSTRQPDEEIQY
tara:strand:+ start:1383 stop:2915 length:1533 start_codon:yes stop_codon:yes gene_type:complete